ncbi:hypothetical protein SynRS9909_00314 [Synechococcus sp. RS9909]|nr:hypothetical protein SynRS9909_00314 [Synechococcus sp. RS9909]
MQQKEAVTVAGDAIIDLQKHQGRGDFAAAFSFEPVID